MRNYVIIRTSIRVLFPTPRQGTAAKDMPDMIIKADHSGRMMCRIACKFSLSNEIEIAFLNIAMLAPTIASC